MSKILSKIGKKKRIAGKKNRLEKKAKQAQAQPQSNARGFYKKNGLNAL